MNDDKPAALYARYSPRPEQAKVNSVTIDTQMDKMRTYCARAGLRVAAEIAEPDVSGSLPLSARPGGQRLLKLIAQGTVEHVVACSIDRLFRKDLDGIQSIESWHKAGLGVHILEWAGMLLDTTTPHGYLVLRLTTAIAEFLRRDISAKSRDSAHWRQRTGIAIGEPPYGWRRERGALVPHPEEQLALRWMKTRAAQGITHRTIARECEQRGYPTRGRKWHHYLIGRALRRAKLGLEPPTENSPPPAPELPSRGEPLEI